MATSPSTCLGSVISLSLPFSLSLTLSLSLAQDGGNSRWPRWLQAVGRALETFQSFPTKITSVVAHQHLLPALAVLALFLSIFFVSSCPIPQRFRILLWEQDCSERATRSLLPIFDLTSKLQATRTHSGWRSRIFCHSPLCPRIERMLEVVPYFSRRNLHYEDAIFFVPLLFNIL